MNSSWGDGIVLELVVIIAQPHECTKSHWIAHQLEILGTMLWLAETSLPLSLRCVIDQFSPFVWDCGSSWDVRLSLLKLRKSQSNYNQKLGLAAHCSKANEEARLVERKVCFISSAGNFGWRWMPVQRLTPTSPSPKLTRSGEELL